MSIGMIAIGIFLAGAWEKGPDGILVDCNCEISTVSRFQQRETLAKTKPFKRTAKWIDIMVVQTYAIAS